MVAARMNGKWLFVRRKDRETWELPGGHSERGETAEDTARRELFEETGAVEYDIRYVADYVLDFPAALFFAEIKTAGAIPAGSEIAESRLFDALPDALAYPNLHPALFTRVQEWLNINTNPNELWDLYTAGRIPTGATHRRGDPMPDGLYHMTVHVWVRNRNGEYLITKRAPNKGYPNLWEAPGGSALAGDTSEQAALRELFEETGIRCSPGEGECVKSFVLGECLVDVWLFRREVALDEIRLLPGETCDVRLATAGEIRRLRDEGRFIPVTPYLDELFLLAEGE